MIEHYIEVSDGAKLKVLDFTPPDIQPSKPVIVFVAGWISLIDGWKDVLAVLTPNYRTIYIETREKISADLPRKKSTDLTIERMGKDIFEIIQQLLPEGQPFYFAGSSLGATVILDYLSRHKRRPIESILISPICTFSIPKWGTCLAKVAHPSFYLAIKPVIKWYLRNFRLDKKNEPEQVAKYEGTLDAAEPRRLKYNALALSRYSLWERLALIDSPVLLIGAKTDALHGTDELKKMAAVIPDAQLELMQSNKETHSKKVGQLIISRMMDI